MKKVPVFPILLVNFVGSLGFSIVLPFLVFLVTKFGGNSMVYGIMGAVYPAFQLVGAPLLGKWSDIYGRKKILLLSQAGTLAGWIIFFVSFYVPVTVIFNVNSNLFGIFAVTVPIIIIFIARAVDGITGGNISVANAYLADITDEKDRNRNFGKMSVSANIGFVAGPTLAGILGATVYAEKLPVLAAIIISLAAVVLILFFLPDSDPKPFKESDAGSGIQKVLGHENKECFKDKHKKNIKLKDVLKIKFIPYFLILYFMIFLGFNFYYTAFPVHAVQKLGWNLGQMGAFFAVLSLLMALVQGPLLSYVSKRISESRLIIFGSFILGINFVLLYSNNTVIIFTSAALFALGNGLMWPSFLSLLSKAAGKVYQGSVQGFANSMGSLASIAGLIAGGVIYARFAEVTFLIAAGVIFIVFVMAFRLLPIEKKCELKPDLGNS